MRPDFPARTALLLLGTCLFAACLSGSCVAQELTVPAAVAAGEETNISTTGSGTATFYLLGPGVSRKDEVSLGQEIHLQAQDVKTAGDYLAILCSGTCRRASFYVNAAKPASVTFLVHPSRVPVGQSNAVSGVAFPFDQFHNLVLVPKTINFQLTTGSSSLLTQPAHTRDGVAWFRTASGKAAGMLQVVASLDDLSAKRAVQEVASDPCNLRIEGQRTASGILVQTEPVHDCAGNPVPDGTIVTFTATDSGGKDTVDAPIKKGIAKAQMDAPGAVVVSAASGVVMGNEIRIGAR
jgi:hypothetical protein